MAGTSRDGSQAAGGAPHARTPPYTLQTLRLQLKLDALFLYPFFFFFFFSWVIPSSKKAPPKNKRGRRGKGHRTKTRSLPPSLHRCLKPKKAREVEAEITTRAFIFRPSVLIRCLRAALLETSVWAEAAPGGAQRSGPRQPPVPIPVPRSGCGCPRSERPRRAVLGVSPSGGSVRTERPHRIVSLRPGGGKGRTFPRRGTAVAQVPLGAPIPLPPEGTAGLARGDPICPQTSPAPSRGERPRSPQRALTDHHAEHVERHEDFPAFHTGTGSVAAQRTDPMVHMARNNAGPTGSKSPGGRDGAAPGRDGAAPADGAGGGTAGPGAGTGRGTPSEHRPKGPERSGGTGGVNAAPERRNPAGVRCSPGCGGPPPSP